MNTIVRKFSNLLTVNFRLYTLHQDYDEDSEKVADTVSGVSGDIEVLSRIST